MISGFSGSFDMTQKTLIEAIRTNAQAEEKSTNQLALAVVVSMVPVVAFAVLSEADFINLPAWTNPLPVAFLFAVIFGLLIGLPLLQKGRLKRLDLQCHHCGKTFDRFLAPVAVASGRCGNCGGKLFEIEEEPKQP